MFKWITFSSMLVTASFFVLPQNTHAQNATYESTVGVFDDVNGNAVQERTEKLLANWTVNLYDDQFRLLTSGITTESSVTLTSDQVPSYICLASQQNWLLTAPSTSITSPGSNWDCHETVLNLEQYLFGIFAVNSDEASEENVENIGIIIPPTDNAEAKEVIEAQIETGAVLGATDEAKVLAATGEAATLLPIAGIIIALVALIIRQDSLKYRL